MEKGLTGFQLKLIAVTAMPVIILPGPLCPLETGWDRLLHFVGRIAAPTMCFFMRKATAMPVPYPDMCCGWHCLPHLATSFTYYDYGRAAFFPLNVIYTPLSWGCWPFTATQLSLRKACVGQPSRCSYCCPFLPVGTCLASCCAWVLRAAG